jgi:DNA-binding Xre family transcriptional regulator
MANIMVKYFIMVWGEKMAISYKKLWKLLIDKDMKKKDLQTAANISSASVAKLGKNENVNTDILLKICNALHCDVSDIMEVEPEDSND